MSDVFVNMTHGNGGVVRQTVTYQAGVQRALYPQVSGVPQISLLDPETLERVAVGRDKPGGWGRLPSNNYISIRRDVS